MNNENNISNMSFEEIIMKLEQITTKLESGSMPLDQAVETYTSGIELKKTAEKQLKNAYLKLQSVQESAIVSKFREQFVILLENFQNSIIQSLESKDSESSIKAKNKEFLSNLIEIYNRSSQ
ncbi:exodeoxyribonuclease VII small subunit [Candidatus Cytomitobacter indipagum]|uniref:Exodeoxyribonuclease 7 small subunit n=1 Tax=Candidatus Cytomitobacter indipagum TaxID=2601575 RepID=A0A5C0UE69_9PROT|nr:exodeoxyribonuclease VII small subunit [Candidatus Cytomitobacter indipagum]QEK38059.1 exodeoxyribonuclease VII small subunit [Candidatus Cytomitobacter indipagum]